MSQKQFDHIINKIKEAAANSEPSFNEAAWQRMEVLLDKESRKKRFFLIWWRIGFPLLLLALVAGGSLILYQQNTTHNKVLSTLGELKKSNKSKTELIPSSTVEATKNNQQEKDKTSVSTLNGEEKREDKILTDNSLLSTKSTAADAEQSPTTNTKKVTVRKKGKAAINISDIEVTESTPFSMNEKATNLAITDSSQNQNTDHLTITNIEPAKVDSFMEQVTTKDEKPSISEKKSAITKKPETSVNSKNSRFYFLAAAGADIAGVRFLSFTESAIQPRFGVGIGYQLSKKISVQTGIFAGRKIYTGGSEDYHPKAGSYWSLVKIKKVEADCLVYDIPISMRYDFLQKPAFNLYAVAGLSSFIMKKEDYYYYYTAYNMAREKQYSYTGNKHLLSNLTLSAGVEKKISPVFSLQAEPYLSIPLMGVGDGQVKLYSAGLLFGLKYTPAFKPVKKK